MSGMRINTGAPAVPTTPPVAPGQSGTNATAACSASAPVAPGRSDAAPTAPGGSAQPGGAPQAAGGGAQGSSAPAGTQSAPPSSSGPGMFGLGVDVGVLTDSVVQRSDPRPRDPADRYERRDRPGESLTPRDDAATRRSGDNPFDKLQRRDAIVRPRELIRQRAGIDRELDPRLETLSRFASLERKLPADARLARVRQGMMLLTADAQSTRGAKLPLDSKQLESLARKLISANLKAVNQEAIKEHVRFFMKMNAAFMASIRGNIQAFVQRVLRECYLIQTELLMDYAAKVKHQNDIKKKTRELLTRARDTKSVWVAEKHKLGSDKLFLAHPPFECAEVDEDTGEVFTRGMTEEDIANWKKVTEAAAANEDGEGISIQSDFELLMGESQLTAADKLLLNKMRKEDDDFICDHLSDLTATMSRMNKDDLVEYFIPMVKELTSGNTDEEELLELYGRLSPCQWLFVASDGFDASFHDTSTLEQAGIVAVDSHAGAAIGAGTGAAAGSVAGGIGAVPGLIVGAIVGGVVGTIGGFVHAMELSGLNDEEVAQLELLGSQAGLAAAEALGVDFSGELTKKPATELLSKLQAKYRSNSPELDPDVPSVGDALRVRTVDELEAYIKKLEERLNSLGDDAQLANVDLQNATQGLQQVLQMMTNISKLLHDSTMEVVRRYAN